MFNLPIAMPSIKTFLHHANALAIIETDKKSLDYLYNYHLQIYWGSPTSFRYDFLCHDGIYPRYPFLTFAWLPAPTFRSLGSDVVDQMRGALATGAYVQPLLDEFFLTGRPSHRSEHLLHQSLVHGYDDENACFIAQGYTREGNYGRYLIYYQDIRTALVDEGGVAIITWTDDIKYSNGRRFSGWLVTSYLEDYLNGRNSFRAMDMPGAAYGREFYGLLVDEVEQRNGREIDIRPWSLLHEHKQKINVLASYVEQLAGASMDEACREELRLVERDFLAFKNHMLEMKLTNRVVGISALQRNLDRVLTGEAEAVKGLIAFIDKHAAGLERAEEG